MDIETDRGAADYIIQEAIGTLEMGGRVRVFCPGGPLEPISIEYTQGGRFVDIETAPGRWAKLISTAIIGWEDLDEFNEVSQSYQPR